MKKQTLQKVFLILLPVLALGLATTMDSVTVVNQQTKEVFYASYFTLIEENAQSMIVPTAALVGLATGILAVVYLIRQKSSLLKNIRLTAFVSATLAVIPVLLQGEIMIVPNVGFPIIMIAEYALAWFMGRTSGEIPEKREPERLKKH